MSYVIITNNDGDLNELLTQHQDNITVHLVKGNIRDVAFQARELLMGSYSLVADPVAGRLERPTPYLTIILKENKQSEVTMGDEIIRVEYFVKVYNEHKEHLEQLSDRYRRDFREIDKSLTLGCCTQMLMGQ